MAQYLILLYEDESAYQEASLELRREVMAEHERFRGHADRLGVKITGGGALEPTATATSIRGDAVTDGPFVETKEDIGGYYLVEARDLDHAIEAARLVPARFGGVEVRPLLDLSQFR